ncbi:hypothetical protein TWF730_003030 [Orbilia blumenaviensis]|uniref:Uncharacterized protein n=1 Tax=Orbilia blumenaviensis TaxID=1796055 RepID=A0AAV9U8H7_9PEZI
MSGQSLELSGNYTPDTNPENADIDWQSIRNLPKGLQQNQKTRSSNIYGASGNWDRQGLEAARQDARRINQSHQYSGSANRGSSYGR